MTMYQDWMPNLLVGVTFLSLGLIKVVGWRRGIVGGGGKPLTCRLLGRCPTWSRPFNLAIIGLWLAIGLVNLGGVVAAVVKA